MKGLYTFLLLTCSNVFMTFAWYSHLHLQKTPWFSKLSLPLVVLFSWGIALAEYSFMVPANRIGYIGNGGPFNLWQLKVIQEFISLTVFTLITIFIFKSETLRINHVIGFCFLVLAVYFIFKK
ncbi:MAG: DMT family protein [Bacteroidales bacterium]|nr:DMT family protein [Bacteroidales bacterium]